MVQGGFALTLTSPGVALTQSKVLPRGFRWGAAVLCPVAGLVYPTGASEFPSLVAGLRMLCVHRSRLVAKLLHGLFSSDPNMCSK